MEDRDSNDVETAAALERRNALPPWPDDESDLADICGSCGRELLPSEGPLCNECWERS
jgi:hypothetical protein